MGILKWVNLGLVLLLLYYSACLGIENISLKEKLRIANSIISIRSEIIYLDDGPVKFIKRPSGVIAKTVK